MIDPAAWTSQSGHSSSPVRAPDRDGATVRAVHRVCAFSLRDSPHNRSSQRRTSIRLSLPSLRQGHMPPPQHSRTRPRVQLKGVSSLWLADKLRSRTLADLRPIVQTRFSTLMTTTTLAASRAHLHPSARGTSRTPYHPSLFPSKELPNPTSVWSALRARS